MLILPRRTTVNIALAGMDEMRTDPGYHIHMVLYPRVTSLLVGVSYN